ncbi:hypothetical protein [Paraburkholderia antibiotica]|uniref:Uncharacterized protein n=1 Tax=Paraburkholderia antibiotica TaxID=2728839 RepID=A0A7X9X2L7_9BURK|nr:hypothetical protein [Paraburkholderia antibiotica]NML30285.1 hypothetical protein [Paraburkholderia antibiotica]
MTGAIARNVATNAAATIAANASPHLGMKPWNRVLSARCKRAKRALCAQQRAMIAQFCGRTDCEIRPASLTFRTSRHGSNASSALPARRARFGAPEDKETQ